MDWEKGKVNRDDVIPKAFDVGFEAFLAFQRLDDLRVSYAASDYESSWKYLESELDGFAEVGILHFMTVFAVRVLSIRCLTNFEYLCS